MGTCQRAAGIDLAAFVADRGATEWADFRAHYPSCSSCATEVAGWSRVVNALRDEATGAPSEHPSEEKLLAFERARASLLAPDAEAIERHLHVCAPCRSELRLLRSFDFASVREPRAEALPVRSRARGGWLARLAGLLRENLVLSLPRPGLALAALVLIAIGLTTWRFQATPDEAALAERKAPEPAFEPLEPAPAPLVAEVEPPPEPAVPEAAPPVPVAEPAAEPPRLAAAEKPVRPPRSDAEPTRPGPPRSELVAGAPFEIAALVPADLLHYADDLPMLGSHVPIRVTGVVRSGAQDATRVQALGPDHTGVVFAESPALYWYLSHDTPLPVELIVTDDSESPLVDITLRGPSRAGLHRFDLAASGARLKPGVAYEWSVTLVGDPDDRSGDVVSKAGVRFEAPSPDLSARLASTEPARLAHTYAAAGSWYQAFAQLSVWIEREPGAEVLRHHRAALLDQVGLGWVAAADRTR